MLLFSIALIGYAPMLGMDVIPVFLIQLFINIAIVIMFNAFFVRLHSRTAVILCALTSTILNIGYVTTYGKGMHFSFSNTHKIYDPSKDYLSVQSYYVTKEQKVLLEKYISTFNYVASQRGIRDVHFLRIIPSYTNDTAAFVVSYSKAGVSSRYFQIFLLKISTPPGLIKTEAEYIIEDLDSTNNFEKDIVGFSEIGHVAEADSTVDRTFCFRLLNDHDILFNSKEKNKARSELCKKSQRLFFESIISENKASYNGESSNIPDSNHIHWIHSRDENQSHPWTKNKRIEEKNFEKLLDLKHAFGEARIIQYFDSGTYKRQVKYQYTVQNVQYIGISNAPEPIAGCEENGWCIGKKLRIMYAVDSPAFNYAYPYRIR
jgi:hypothetical protein